MTIQETDTQNDLANFNLMGRCGRDRMVVGFTTGEVYSKQHYVIKFVSDRFPPPIKLIATI